MTLNVRSINQQTKASQLLAQLALHKPTISIITETWLQRKLIYSLRGVKSAQSDPAPNQGVLILASKPVMNMQPVLEECRTVNTIAVICNVQVTKHLQIPVHVIGHYSQPGRKQQLDEELTYFVRTIRECTPQASFIVAGDFNRSVFEMDQFARKLNLKLAQAPEAEYVTHLNARNFRQSKQLDYILTNMDSSDTHIPASFRFPSDHLPLSTSLTWPANLRLPRPIRYKRVVVLAKDLTPDELTRILEDPRWPDKPFIKVATKLGLTEVHHIPQAPGKRFKHLVNDADLKEQLQLLAQPNAKNELFVRLLQKNTPACDIIMDRATDIKNRCVLNRSDATQEVAMAQLTEQLSGISLEPLPEPDPVIEPNARLIKAFQDLPQTMRNNFSTQFHRDLPKEFFNVVSSMAYMKRKGHIAKSFRASEEHPEPPTFAKYFQDLCNREFQQVLYKPRSENQTRYPPITEAEVDWALSSIGKKATGIDCLGHLILK